MVGSLGSDKTQMALSWESAVIHGDEWPEAKSYSSLGNICRPLGPSPVDCVSRDSIVYQRDFRTGVIRGTTCPECEWDSLRYSHI